MPELRHSVSATLALHSLKHLHELLHRWRSVTGTRLTPRRQTDGNTGSDPGRQLFDAVRGRVYPAWPISFEGIRAIALQESGRFDGRIGNRQLEKMCVSVWDFMTKHYVPRTSSGVGPRRGRDGAEPEVQKLDVKQRQALAGRRTAEQRKENSLRRLIAAHHDLRLQGRVVTQAAVAAAAGMSERTVKRHWPRIAG